MNYLWPDINFPEMWILSRNPDLILSFACGDGTEPSSAVKELTPRQVLVIYVGQTSWALKGRKTKSRGSGPQTSCWTIFLLELKMSRQSYFVFAKVCNVSPRLLFQYSPLSYFCFIILIFHWITKSFQLFPSTISCFSADFSMVENIILAGTHFMTQFGCFARGNHSSAWRTGGGGHGTLCYIGGGHGTLSYTVVDMVHVLHCWLWTRCHGTCAPTLVVDTVVHCYIVGDGHCGHYGGHGTCGLTLVVDTVVHRYTVDTVMDTVHWYIVGGGHGTLLQCSWIGSSQCVHLKAHLEDIFHP